MEIKSLEMVSVPKVVLEEGLAYYTAQKERYTAYKMTEMAEWAEGKASVYKQLLETYGQ